MFQLDVKNAFLYEILYDDLEEVYVAISWVCCLGGGYGVQAQEGDKWS